MALTIDGLTVPTFQEVISEIITQEQTNVSPSINVSDDTALGQLNQIFAAQIATTNQLLQDIYDQRNIFAAEGKALDDNVSWLGVFRQGAAATSGEAYFTGIDGTVISGGSLVQNDSTKEAYTLDLAVSIDKAACREIIIKLVTPSAPLDNTNYDVTIQGRLYQGIVVTSATNDLIIADLQSKINAAFIADTLNYDAVVIPGVGETDTLKVFVIPPSVDHPVPTDISVSLDIKLQPEEVTSAGNITGVNTGSLAAPANTVTNILSPTSGWTDVNNPIQLVIGRAIETDNELRNRAVAFKAAGGTATLDSITATLLAVSGVATVSINERLVSSGVADTVFTVGTLAAATTYSVDIQGITFSFTSGGIPTNNDVTSALVADINAEPCLEFFAIDNMDGTFTVDGSKLLSHIAVANPLNLTFVEAQPAGSIQCVVAGGTDNDAIAQAIWDSKPAGVEVWAVPPFQVGNAVDISGTTQVIEFNRPTSILITPIDITYKVFDETSYPGTDQEAFDAIKVAVTEFGNQLGAGANVIPGEFETIVYCAVDGITQVLIEMTGNATFATSAILDDFIPIATDEAAFFDADDPGFTVANIT